MAQENGVEQVAYDSWTTDFLNRHGFTLRKATNLTTLTDSQLAQRAVDYISYLQSRLNALSLQKTLLMDETAIYFEDPRTHIVDTRGARHVVLKSTGFASMRITAAVSVWANGRKASPLVIHKGKDNGTIFRQNGSILYTTQLKAWVNSDLIIAWIDALFPLIDTSHGKCIVWDSCRAHVSKKVKDHCKKRRIESIIIPGGMTLYLQAGDIGIFRELKNHLSLIIDSWKNSANVEYTKNGNPKAPDHSIVQSWVSDAWTKVSMDTIASSIKAAGFHRDSQEWFITKHDVYGEEFSKAWSERMEMDIELSQLEAIPQDDELFDCIDDNM